MQHVCKRLHLHTVVESEAVGKVQFRIIFLGVNLTFLPQHFLGLNTPVHPGSTPKSMSGPPIDLSHILGTSELGTFCDGDEPMLDLSWVSYPVNMFISFPITIFPSIYILSSPPVIWPIVLKTKTLQVCQILLSTYCVRFVRKNGFWKDVYKMQMNCVWLDFWSMKC